MKLLFRINLILSMLLCIACSPVQDTNEEQSNRAETVALLLENWSVNVVPNTFNTYIDALSEMQDNWNTVSEDGIVSTDEINTIQTTLRSAWEQFEQVSAFNYGPSDLNLLNAYVNTFPTDTALILENISTNNTNLDPVSQIDAQGFPALDFLLNSNSELNEEEVAYTTLIIERIVTVSNTVSTEFQSTSHQTAFQENNGSDINSSMAVATNAMIKEFEVIKNPRIGIPLGKKTLGTQRPEQVEARYGKYSIALARKNWTGIQAIYYGSNPRNDAAVGLNDLLEGMELQADIDNQIALITQSFDAIPTDNLQEALQNHVSELNELHDAIQGLVVLWKTDMMSTLGLQINYQDNDGD